MADTIQQIQARYRRRTDEIIARANGEYRKAWDDDERDEIHKRERADLDAAQEALVRDMRPYRG